MPEWPGRAGPRAVSYKAWPLPQVGQPTEVVTVAVKTDPQAHS